MSSATDVVVTNSGLFTKGATGAITAPTGFSTTGDVSLANNITTTDTNLTIGGSTVLAGNVLLSTGAGAGDITFAGTVDGTTDDIETLGLTAGTGDIHFTGVVGGVKKLGALTITSAADVTVDAAITAASITQVAGSGTTSFNNHVVTDAVGGIVLTGNIFNFYGSVSTIAAAPFTLTNTGLATFGPVADLSLGGAFTQTGGGSVLTAGDIVTTGDVISFADAVALFGNVVWNTSLELATGANITATSAVTQTVGSTLTVNAGTGSAVLFSSNVTLDGLTVTNSGTTTITGTTNVGAVTISDTATSVLFTGAVTITSLTTATGSYSMTFNGGGTVTNSTVFGNAGGVTFGGAYTTTFTNGVDTSAGATSLNGIIAVTNSASAMIMGSTTIIDNSSLTTNAGTISIGFLTLNGGNLIVDSKAATETGANILFAGAVSNTASETMTVHAGSAGTVSFLQSVTLEALTIGTSNTLGFDAALVVTGALTQTNAATGTTTFSSTVSVGSADLKGVAYSVNNSFAATGSITVANSGLFTKEATGVITAATGFSATGAVSLANNITTTNSNLSIGGSLTLAPSANITLSTGAGAGDVTVTGAVIASTAGGEIFTVTAGTGGLTLSSTVGSSVGGFVLGAISLTSDTIALGGNIYGNSTILLQPTTVSQTIGIGDGASGTYSLSATEIGYLQNGFTEITIGRSDGTGAIRINAITFNDPVIIRCPGVGGSIAVNGQITGQGNASIYIDGPGATTTLTADIVTQAQPITISDSVVLNNASGITLDTTDSGNLLYVAGASISIAGKVQDTSTGKSPFTLNAGSSGDITLTLSVGDVTPIQSIHTISGGTVYLPDVITTGNQTYSGVLSGSTRVVRLNGDYTTTSNGSFVTETGAQVILVNHSTISTGSGAISFGSTVDALAAGSQGLEITSTGAKTFSGDVGLTNKLMYLQSLGAGTLSLQSVTTDAFQSYDTDTAVSLNGTYTTSNANFTVLVGPVTLLGNANIVTGGGNIQFGSTINGNFSIDFNACTPGRITLSSPVGGSAALVNVTLTTNVLISHGINYTGTKTISSCGGTVELCGTETIGALDFTVPGDAVLTCDTIIDGTTGDITFGGTVNGAHALTVTSTGDKTFGGIVGGTTSLTSLTSTGAGTLSMVSVTTTGAQTYTADTAITLSGSYTTSNATFTTGNSGAVVLAQDVTVATSGANIVFGSTVNGAYTLNLNAGSTGIVQFLADVGATTPLAKVVATANAITSGSTLKTTAVGGVGVLYTGVGTTPTISLGGDITSDLGSITMTGGAVTLSADVTLDTTNAGVSAAGASISFSDSAATIGGSHNLTLRAGTAGGITLAGNIIALGDASTNDSLTIVSTVTDPVVFPAMTLVGGLNMPGFNASFGSTTTIAGRISASNVTTTGAVNIAFNDAGAQGSAITGTTSFGNTGTLTFGSEVGSIITFTNALAANAASAVHTMGAVRSIGQPISMTTVVLDGTTTIDSTNNGDVVAGANVTFETTVDGDAGLVVFAGRTGTIHFVDDVGFTTPLTIVQTSSYVLTVSSNIKTTVLSGNGVIHNGSFTGSTVNLGGDIITAGGLVYFQSAAVTLTSDVLIDTTNAGVVSAGAGITFADSVTTITGAHNLTLRAGSSGAIALIGAITGLGDLNTKDSLTIISTVTSPVGFPELTLVGGLSMAGVNASFGYATTVGGRILAADVTTGGLSAVAFNDAGAQGSIITGATSFGNLGTLTLGSVAGSSTTFTNALDNHLTSAINVAGTVAVTTASSTMSIGALNVTANASLTTNSGAVNVTGIVTLAGSLTLDSSLGGGANITLGNDLNGNFALTVNAGSGAVSLSGIGNTTAIGTTVVTGSTVNLGGVVTLSSGSSLTVTNSDIWSVNGITITAPGGITQNGSAGITLLGGATFTTASGNGDIVIAQGILGAGNALTMDAGTGSITLNTVGAAAPNKLGAISLTSDAITLGGNIYGSSTIVFQPTTASKDIYLGWIPDVGNYTLSSAYIAYLQAGFTGITIGRANSSGAINVCVDGITFTSPVTIQSPGVGGSILVEGPITGTGLASIHLIGPGATTTLEADITTNGAPITITDNVILNNAAGVSLNTTLGGSASGANISITGTVVDTVSGRTPFTLIAGTSGNITVGGAIGAPTAIKSLSTTAGGTVTLVNVTTTGAQTYSGNGASSAVNLNGSSYSTTDSNFTLNSGAVAVLGNGVTISTGTGNISFGSTVRGAHALTVTSTGAKTFSGIVGGAGSALSSLTSTGAGTLSMVSVTTTGAQTYNSDTAISLNGTYTTTNAAFSVGTGAVTLLGSTIVTTGSGAISFGGAIGGSYALTVTSTAAKTFSGIVGGAGSALSSLTSTGAGTLSMVSVTTTGAQTYDEDTLVSLNGTYTTTNAAFSIANGAVTLAGSTTVTTGAGNISFGSTIDGFNDLIVTSTGSKTFSGIVGGTTALSYMSSTGIGQLSMLSVTTQGAQVYDTDSLVTLNGDYSTRGNAGTNNAHFSMSAVAVTLAGDSTVSTGSGAITFGATIDGAKALTITATGSKSFTAVVGGTTAPTSVTSLGAGTLSMVSVTTTGAQTYDEDTVVSLNGTYTTTDAAFSVGTGTATLLGSTIVTTGSGAITFGAAIIGAHDLTVTSSGAQTFSGIVGDTTSGAALTSFTVSGTGAVTLTGIGIAIESGVTGATSIDGSVGGITLNGGTYYANAQTYTGAVTLGANTTITTSNDAVLFDSTINGAHNLTAVLGLGNLTFTGNVGGVTRLGDITITSAGDISAAAVFAQSFTITSATGTTTFGGTLNTNAVGGISITGTTINFNSTVATTGTGPFTLVHTGVATFSDQVTLDGAFNESGVSGTVVLGADITTTGDIIHMVNPVSLSNDVTLISLGANITFDSNITNPGLPTAARSLTITACTGGVITLQDVGTLLAPLNVFTATAEGVHAGTIHSDSESISACDTIVYLSGIYNTGGANFLVNGNAILTDNVVINAGAGNISFTGTTNGAFSLIANSSGIIAFSGEIGETTPLTAFTTDAGGSSSFHGITTTGAQLLGDDTITLRGSCITSDSNFTASGAVTLGSDTTITIGTGVVNFGSTVDGAYSLTVSNTGGRTFAGAIGGTTALTSLSTIGAGAESFQSVTTTGNQSYGGTTVSLNGLYTSESDGNFMVVSGATTLAGDVTITVGSGEITFFGTIDGANDLILNSVGGITLDGDIGLTTPLTSITTSLGSSALIEGDVTTTGIQSYGGNISVGGVVLTTTDAAFTVSGTVTLTGAVDIAAGTGNVTIYSIEGTIGGVENLGIVGGDILFTGNVGQTTGPGYITLTGSTYTANGNVTALNLTTLQGGQVQIDGTLDVGSLDLAGSPANYDVIFHDVSVGSDVTLSNTGTVTADSIYVWGNFIATMPSSVTVNTEATTHGAMSFTTLYSGNASYVTNGGNFLVASDLEAVTLGDNVSIDAGAGLVTINGIIESTVELGDLSITSSSFTSLNDIEILGDMYFNVSGTTSLLNVTSGGSFTQVGGPVSLGGNITTDHALIDIAGVITLIADVEMNTMDSADITLHSDLTGAYALILYAGASGDVSFAGINVNSSDITGNVMSQVGNLAATNSASYTGAILYLNGNISSPVVNIDADVVVSTPDALIQSTVLSKMGSDRFGFISGLTITGTVESSDPANSLTIDYAAGFVDIYGAIGVTGPFQDLTITGQGVRIRSDVGTVDSLGVNRALSITSTSTITMNSLAVAADTQSYTATSMTLDSAGTADFRALTGGIDFATPLILASGTHLTIVCTTGAVVITDLQANALGDVAINTTTGRLVLGPVGTIGVVGSLGISVGEIDLRGNISAGGNMFMRVVGAIDNPVGIVISNTTTSEIFIDSITSFVGTTLNPININFPNATTYVGAIGPAYFTGVAATNVVYCDPSELPTFVVFNGVTTYCSPTPPPPPPGPHHKVWLPANIFFVPGVTTIQGSLAGQMYYLPDFLSGNMVDRQAPVYYIPNSQKATSIKDAEEYVKEEILEEQVG